MSRWSFTAVAQIRCQVSPLFVVDKVALGQGFLRVLGLSLYNIIPVVLHTHLYLYAALPGQTGEVWEPSKKAVLF